MQAALKDYDVSVIFGHIHRMEMALRTKYDRKGAYTIGGVFAGLPVSRGWRGAGTEEAAELAAGRRRGAV